MHNYTQQNKNRRVKCEHCPSPNEVLITSNKILRSLGTPRRKWEDNIKMGLQEVGCGDMDWIELAQNSDRWQALVNAVMNLRVP